MMPAPIDVDVGNADGCRIDMQFPGVVAADIMDAGDEFAAKFLDPGEIGDSVAHPRRPGLLRKPALLEAAPSHAVEYPEIVEQVDHDVLWHQTAARQPMANGCRRDR